MTANMTHPKTVGDITQAIVLARLVEAGHEVLLPFGENQRYDLVIDHGDRFTRVQCKTGRLLKGGVYFPPKNNQGARIRWAKDYALHPPG